MWLDKEKEKKYRKDYREKNKERLRQYRLEYYQRVNAERKLNKWGHYSKGYKCSVCTAPMVNVRKFDKCKKCAHRIDGVAKFRKGTTTREHAQKISLAFKRRRELGLKRKPLSVETRKRMSIAKSGSNAPFWRGGITPINTLIRQSLKYRLWREMVFKRDNYTCVLCGQYGGKLNADHIKRFSDFPELRFELSNGRTLCIPCHKTTENFGTKGLKGRTGIAMRKRILQGEQKAF